MEASHRYGLLTFVCANARDRDDDDTAPVSHRWVELLMIVMISAVTTVATPSAIDTRSAIDARASSGRAIAFATGIALCASPLGDHRGTGRGPLVGPANMIATTAHPVTAGGRRT